MANSNAPRDANRKAVGLGVNGSDTLPIRVDASTSRLLIDISSATTTIPSTLSVVRDGNFVPVTCGVTDDVAQTITPIPVDNRSGYLWVDVVFE